MRAVRVAVPILVALLGVTGSVAAGNTALYFTDDSIGTSPLVSLETPAGEIEAYNKIHHYAATLERPSGAVEAVPVPMSTPAAAAPVVFGYNASQAYRIEGPMNVSFWLQCRGEAVNPGTSGPVDEATIPSGRVEIHRMGGDGEAKLGEDAFQLDGRLCGEDRHHVEATIPPNATEIPANATLQVRVLVFVGPTLQDHDETRRVEVLLDGPETPSRLDVDGLPDLSSADDQTSKETVQLEVEFVDAPNAASAGTVAEYRVRVDNVGDAEADVTASAANSPAWPTTITPTDTTIAANGSTSFDVEVEIPDDAQGTESTLQATFETGDTTARVSTTTLIEAAGTDAADPDPPTKNPDGEAPGTALPGFQALLALAAILVALRRR